MGYDTTAWTTAGNTLTIGGTTMYADFFVNSIDSISFAAGYHEILTFGNANFTVETDYTPNLGNDPDPATSFTTANSAGSKASDLVHCLWYLPDNIYVDAVYSLEGADSATGDTTRMHLMSFDFTSGATACLTNGTLVAHSSDVTNDGSEQPYLSTWTVDNNSVSSSKVIVATFEQDGTNTDYSINVKVKYHLV